ncbi:MAG: prohibitin family protein [Armatimonadaceae bacterium]
MGLVFFGFVLLVLSFMLPKAFSDTRRNVGGYAMIGRVIGILLMVAGTVSAGLVIIPAGHRGVLMQFGAVKGVIGEGIHLIVPQMNTVELIEVRTQKEQTQSTAASRDLQMVTTTVAINYHLDPEGVDDLFQKVGTEYRVRIIDPVTQESLKAVTARYTAEELIQQRDKVKSEVEQDMTERLRPYNIVVEPSGVSITDFAFSEDFNRAIEQKQVAQQTAEKQKYILQQAKLEAETAITKAKGEAEAARINASSLQASGGSRVLAREWIEKWDGKLPTFMGGNSSNMIVDFREMMKQDTSNNR